MRRRKQLKSLNERSPDRAGYCLLLVSAAIALSSTHGLAKDRNVEAVAGWQTTVVQDVNVASRESSLASRADIQIPGGAVTAPPNESAPGQDRPFAPASPDGDDVTKVNTFVASSFSITSTLGVMGLSLTAALLGSILSGAASLLALVVPVGVRKRGANRSKGALVDIRQECRSLVDHAAVLWQQAEAAVFQLGDTAPLRALLLSELSSVKKRLAMVVAEPAVSSGRSLATTFSNDEFVLLRQRLRRNIRELQRIAATANAASATVGRRERTPQIPKSRSEALLVLGANQSADEPTLNRLVRALRQCWHPDLASNDNDRTYREARIAQINVAYDILLGRRAEG